MDGDWSGSGSSSKEVFNEITSVLQNNRLQKFAQETVKAQPRTSHGLNNAISSNHIEADKSNSNSNPVLIDDFYYDYNFIKFHEDLSYDFENEDDHSEIEQAKLTVYKESTSTSTSSSTVLPTVSLSPFNKNKSPGFHQQDKSYLEDDYFLPFDMTTKPPSAITSLSEDNKNLADLALTQDLSIIQNSITREVPTNHDVQHSQAPYVHSTESVYNTGEFTTDDYSTLMPVNPKDSVELPMEYEDMNVEDDKYEQKSYKPPYLFSTQSTTDEYKLKYDLTTERTLASSLSKSLLMTTTGEQDVTKSNRFKPSSPTEIDYSNALVPPLAMFTQLFTPGFLESQTQGTTDENEAITSETGLDFMQPTATTAFWRAGNWSSVSSSLLLVLLTSG